MRTRLPAHPRHEEREVAEEAVEDAPPGKLLQGPAGLRQSLVPVPEARTPTGPAAQLTRHEREVRLLQLPARVHLLEELVAPPEDPRVDVDGLAVGRLHRVLAHQRGGRRLAAAQHRDDLPRLFLVGMRCGVAEFGQVRREPALEAVAGPAAPAPARAEEGLPLEEHAAQAHALDECVVLGGDDRRVLCAELPGGLGVCGNGGCGRRDGRDCAPHFVTPS